MPDPRLWCVADGKRKVVPHEDDKDEEEHSSKARGADRKDSWDDENDDNPAPWRTRKKKGPRAVNFPEDAGEENQEEQQQQRAQPAARAPPAPRRGSNPDETVRRGKAPRRQHRLQPIRQQQQPLDQRNGQNQPAMARMPSIKDITHTIRSLWSGQSTEDGDEEGEEEESDDDGEQNGQTIRIDSDDDQEGGQDDSEAEEDGRDWNEGRDSQS